MKLEFEGKIYSRFLILTKKKYIAQMLDEKGNTKDSMYMRGVPLIRREYCVHFKKIYQQCVTSIINHIELITNSTKEELRKHTFYSDYMQMVFQHFLNALTWNTAGEAPAQGQIKTSMKPTAHKDFVIYKGYKKEDYKVPQAHVEVAKKMNMRGTPVAVNTRIEYLLLADHNNEWKEKKQYQISEDVAYFEALCEHLRIDLLQYFNSQYVNLLDQMTVVIFGRDPAQKKPPVESLINLFIQKNKYVTQLKKAFMYYSLQIVDSTCDKKVYFNTMITDLGISNWCMEVHAVLCMKFKLSEFVYHGIVGTFYFDWLAHAIALKQGGTIINEEQLAQVFASTQLWWINNAPFAGKNSMVYPFVKLVDPMQNFLVGGLPYDEQGHLEQFREVYKTIASVLNTNYESVNDKDSDAAILRKVMNRNAPTLPKHYFFSLPELDERVNGSNADPSKLVATMIWYEDQRKLQHKPQKLPCKPCFSADLFSMRQTEEVEDEKMLDAIWKDWVDSRTVDRADDHKHMLKYKWSSLDAFNYRADIAEARSTIVELHKTLMDSQIVVIKGGRKRRSKDSEAKPKETKSRKTTH